MIFFADDTLADREKSVKRLGRPLNARAVSRTGSPQEIPMTGIFEITRGRGMKTRAGGGRVLETGSLPVFSGRR